MSQSPIQSSAGITQYDEAESMAKNIPPKTILSITALFATVTLLGSIAI